MNSAEPLVRNNRHHHRFELEIDGKLSIIAYQDIDDQTLAVVHTEVDRSLEGKGVGSRLVAGMLSYVESHDLKIVPLCPFVAAYLERHPEWSHVVSTEYSVNDF
ncbi:GNAT family N-acetyltransferase [Spirosoma sp. SC4-14]|uniref:GNAT family N-acetyltransferase n=1 Tax=Spirosoma sp. SC4-14 TaxID=3128900 RepID=UPI0030CAA920